MMGAEAATAATALLAEALGVPPAQIPPTATIGALPGWDSLGHLRLILSLEERLGRLLSSDEVLSLTSVANIARVLTHA